MNLRPTSSVVSASQGNVLVLMHFDDGTYYRLNETASRIWTLACAGSDEAAIVDLITTEFGADATGVAGDVRSTMEKFTSLNLLVQA
jgi:hypothetical protein